MKIFKFRKLFISISFLIVFLFLILGPVSASNPLDDNSTLLADTNVNNGNYEVLSSNLTLNEASSNLSQVKLNDGEVLSDSGSGDYYVDWNTSSYSHDGSINHPFKTIKDAVSKTNETYFNDYTINIAPGIYNENNMFISKDITFVKTPNTIGEVVINGMQGQIFSTSSSDVSFVNLTFTNSSAYSGSVISISSYANLKLINCKIENSKNSYGGAIYQWGGSISCINSVFTNNGGLHGGGIFAQVSNVYILNSSFNDNYAGFHGGAVYVDTGSLTCNNCNFTNNNVNGNNSSGGAITVIGDCSLNNCNLLNNHISGIFSTGGAVDVSRYLICTNTFFNGNNALGNQSYGGAVNLHNGTLILINSSLSNNKAIGNHNYGGAVNVYQGNISCIDTCFINNDDIAITLSNGSIKTNNVEISGNAGGISAINGSIFCVNTIFNGSSGHNGTIELNKGNVTCINTSVSNSVNKTIMITNGNLTCTDSSFINNVNLINLGNGTINLNNDYFKDNKNGVISVWENGNVNCKDTSFIRNNDSVIYMNNGSIYCTGTLFNGNIGEWGSAISVSNNSNVTCNYCVFLNNTSINNNIIYLNNGYCNVDYNWWGCNNPSTNNITVNKTTFKPTNSVYLIITPNSINDALNTNHSISLSLKQYLGLDGNLHILNGNLPSSYVNLNTNIGTLSVNNGYTSNNIFNFQYTTANTSGNGFIQILMDNKAYMIPVQTYNASVPGIYGNDLIMTFGNQANYTGKLIGENGKLLIGQHVSLNLTRLSDGASKVYWATTDNNGEYQLAINLYPGSYTAKAEYGNYSYINSITVLKNTSNLTVTILSADKFQAPFGAGHNFTGKLLDINHNVIIGQHIALNLTRLSDGASKVYWATTDVNGEYQLAINLYAGDYTAQCSYAGTSQYEPSNAANTITVI